MAVTLRLVASPRAAAALVVAKALGPRRLLELASGAESARRLDLKRRVSERDFADYAGQLADARWFLKRYRRQLGAVMVTRGVYRACLDFGVADEIDGGRGPQVAMFHFPADFVSVAGALGLSLELSIHPVYQR
jgi:hypothetical protein